MQEMIRTQELVSREGAEVPINLPGSARDIVYAATDRDSIGLRQPMGTGSAMSKLFIKRKPKMFAAACQVVERRHFGTMSLSHRRRFC